MNTSTITRRSFVKGSAAVLGLAACDNLLGLSSVLADEKPAQTGDIAPADEIVIFHTNDMHGYMIGDGSKVAGIDYVAGLKSTVPNALLLDAGDPTQGAPLASLSQGSSPIDLMNYAGYDAMCLGNHEFDYGTDVLLQNVAAAKFPVLGANVLSQEGAVLTAGVGVSGDGCSTVLECGGRRIGVFGLTTTYTVMPEYVKDLTFNDEIKTAEEQIAKLADQQVDTIICLAHLGNGNVPCRAVELAKYLKPESAARVSVIIDGHSHAVENALVQGVTVVQTGCYLNAVGKLTLSFKDDGVSCAVELLDVATVMSDAQPDANVSQELKKINDEQQKILNVEICENPTTLWAGWVNQKTIDNPTRIVETNFANVVCDAYRTAAKSYMESIGDTSTPIVGVVNGGAIRDKMIRGMLIRGDFVTAFPFSNTVMVKKVTPSFLKGFFEWGFSACDGQDTATGMLLQTEVNGEFEQVTGLKVVADPGQVAGQRVISMTLDGADTPLDMTDDQTPLVLVSNSYIMTGAYSPLADVDLTAEIGGDLESIEAYFKTLLENAGGESLPAMPGTQGNIAFRASGYEPAPTWTATVLITNSDGKPAANTEVTIQVDSADTFTVTTNADGFANLEVSDGQHALALADDRIQDPKNRISEAFISNYMGIGLVEDDCRDWPVLQMQ